MHTLHDRDTPPAPAPSDPPSAPAAPAHPHRTIADALGHGSALRAVGALTDAYTWANYAHHLSQRLPADHPHCAQAAALLAPLAAQTGHPHLAVTIYTDLIAATSARLGGDHADTLHARAALAELRHRLGDCDTALRDLADIHADAQHRHGHHSHLALRTLTTLGRLYRDCGHTDVAARCLATAHTGTARYLPPDDPHRDVVAAALTTPPSLNHPAVCTAVRHQQRQAGSLPHTHHTSHKTTQG